MEDKQRVIVLEPAGHGDGTPWTVKLSDELLSLNHADGSSAMAVQREEASRYLRFSWHCLHGWLITFLLMGSNRRYAFRCPAAIRQAFMDWLPHETRSGIKRNARASGAAAALVGGAVLAIPQQLPYPIGLLFLGFGLIALLVPRRGSNLMLGGAMAVAGLAALYTHAFAGGTAITLVAGALFLCWSTQQFALANPNHVLRLSRAARDKSVEHDEPVHSRLVRAIGRSSALSAVVFLAYTFGLWVYDSATTDVSIFLVLSLFSGSAAAVLLLRKQPPYLEAKNCARALIVMWVLFAWGVGANYQRGELSSLFSGTISKGLFLLEQPYVWIPLIVLILAFNRWFAVASEREREANRD